MPDQSPPSPERASVAMDCRQVGQRWQEKQFELVTIEPDQTILRSQPQVTILRLRDGVDPVGGQTGLAGPNSAIEPARFSRRIKGHAARSGRPGKPATGPAANGSKFVSQ